MKTIENIIVWVIPILISISILILAILLIRYVIRYISAKRPKWFLLELEKMFNKYQNREVQVHDLIHKIPIKEGNRIILFQLQEIVDFSIINNHVFLTDKSGNEFLADFNLSELEEKLPDCFKRIHRSTIINTDLINEVRKLENGKFDIVMRCDQQRVLTCSKNYNDSIKSLINL